MSLPHSSPENKTALRPQSVAVLARLVRDLDVSAELVEKLDEPGRTFARNIQAASPEDRADTLDRVMTGNPEKDAIVAAILATDTEEPVAEEHGGYPVYSLDERCEEDNEPDWVVDGVAQRGGLTVVTGAPGSKKTYLMMYMGMCTATCQTTWLGRAIVPGKVLFIDEESGEDATGAERARFGAGPIFPTQTNSS